MRTALRIDKVKAVTAVVRGASNLVFGQAGLATGHAEFRDAELPTRSGALPFRIYTPPSDPEGVIVFYHGGGWIAGGLETHHDLAGRICAASGCTVVFVRYRLAPEHLYPAQIEDAEDALDWVLAQQRVGVFTGPVAVAGDSAGAYQAVMAAQAVNARTPGAVVGQLLLYPLIGIDPERWAEPRRSPSRQVGRMAVRHINEALGAQGVSVADLCDRMDGNLPFTMILNSRRDPTWPDSERFAKALESAGVEVELRDRLIWPHGSLSYANRSRRLAGVVQDVASDFGARLAGSGAEQVNDRDTFANAEHHHQEKQC